MSEDRAKRRLTAILAADVVGYSRLMGADELGTLSALKEIKEKLFDPNVVKYGGRIVKLMGDGLLIEFTSVVDAIECAVGIQHGAIEYNSEVPESKRILFRIGVNLGDIIVDDDDIYGDGVNVAARLEGMAPPGGICVSRAAYDQIRDKLDYSFVDCGEQTLKNISRPIRVYRLAAPNEESGSPKPPRLFYRRRMLLSSLGVFFIIVALATWSGISRMELFDSDELPALDHPRLSIAVLPLQNLSGDSSKDYFADALTEDLTADLSRISGSFVISYRTAATYKGKEVDARTVADELNVRYLLAGAVRPARANIRVNVQLIDGRSGQELWSERYEKSEGDIYAFQSEVTGRVARALNLELKDVVSRERARGGVENLDSKDFALRAWSEIWNKPQSPETNEAGLEYVERALELDPENAEALGVAAYAYARAANYGWGLSREEGIKKGIESGEKSLELDPNNADTLYSLGFVYYIAGETRKSLDLMRQCIEVNRNHAPAYFFSGLGLIRLGKPREAISWVERAFSLSPRDPLRSVWYAIIGRAQVILGEDSEAIENALKGVASNSSNVHNYAVLAAAYAHLGQMDKSRESLNKLLELMPEITVSQYQLMAASTSPVAIKTYHRMIEGLRKSGLREE